MRWSFQKKGGDRQFWRSEQSRRKVLLGKTCRPQEAGSGCVGAINMASKLSSGTLGLKFMQRSQQPAPQNNPAAPAGAEINRWQTASSKDKGKQKAADSAKIKREDAGTDGQDVKSVCCLP